LSPDTEPPRPAQIEGRDSRLAGCGMGCLIQIVFVLVSYAIATQVWTNTVPTLILSAWGLTQWIGIVPLILWERKKERPKTVQGLLITGALGLLLSSACAGMFSR
jgi:hypothetical protein